MNNENDDQTKDDDATTESPRGSGLGALPCSTIATPRTDAACWESRIRGYGSIENCDPDLVLADFARDLERSNNALRAALVELRRWVGDGDCSDDAGCVGWQTTAYRDVIAQADAAILSNAKMSCDPRKEESK